jgi:hypothetical protein
LRVDLDQDGVDDLLLSGFYSEQLACQTLGLRGRGDGTFEASREVAAPAVMSVRAARDLDGDGIVDLIGLGGRGALVVRRGLAGGRFDDPVVVRSSPDWLVEWTHTGPADLDEDGRPDLVYASGLSGTFPEVLLNRGGLSFTAPMPVPDPVWQCSGVDVADVDGDGHEDVVWVGWSGTSTDLQGPLHVSFGDGQGGFVRSTSIPFAPVGGFDPFGPFAATARHVLATDVDGDGGVDLVSWATTQSVAGDGLMIARGRGDGTFATPRWVPALSDPWDGYAGEPSGRVLACDLDGDGRAELVTCSGPLVTVLDLRPAAGP